MLDILVKLSGLMNWLKYKKNEDRIVIDEEGVRTVIKHRTYLNNKFFVKFINYTYKFLIMCLIGWTLISSLIDWINEPLNYNAFVLNLFSLLNIVVYLLGIKYFTGHHFKSIKNKITAEIKVIIFKYSVSCASIMVILHIIFLYTNIEINGYTQIFNDSDVVQKVFLTMLLILDSFFSYINYFMIIGGFMSVMNYHASQIKEYTKKYKETIIDIEGGMEMGTLIKDFVEIKHSYGKSVVAFNEIFPIIHIVGAISSFFIMNMMLRNIQKTPVIHIINVVVFIIVMLLYYWMNGITNGCKETIYKEHTSPLVMSRIYSRNIDTVKMDSLIKKRKKNSFKFEKVEPLDIEDIDLSDLKSPDKSQTNDNVAIELRNNQLIESYIQMSYWQTLKEEFSSPWTDFTFLSVPLQNLNVIQKVILGIISLILSIEIAGNV
jgi:hypothetical protein